MHISNTIIDFLHVGTRIGQRNDVGTSCDTAFLQQTSTTATCCACLGAHGQFSRNRCQPEFHIMSIQGSLKFLAVGIFELELNPMRAELENGKD